MKAPFRIGFALGLAACIAGCAIPPSRAPSGIAASLRTKIIAADQITNAVTAGKSTTADVLAAFGETLVIGFDTGFEVWVYRLENDAPAKETQTQRIARMRPDQAAIGTSPEFVILFAPSGVVAKTRIRPAPQRGHEQ